jgi:ring-1,2-phenylacetyl-CoA epoxidase subunit PaaB
MTDMPGGPLWEVFIRPGRGFPHTHVGSLHATDAALALRNARDLYTRRGEGESIWVVPSAAVTASSPDERDSFFDPAAESPTATPPSSPCPTAWRTCERRVRPPAR